MCFRFCSSTQDVGCIVAGQTLDSETCSLPSTLFTLSALTQLSFGMRHPSSQRPGPPRPDYSIPELPAELCQQLRSFLQVFSCEVVRLPADISLLTGGAGT